jgi:putative heme-binding domain-containing protein
VSALRDGPVHAEDLSADQVRQLRALGNETINQTLDELWGVTRSTPAERQQQIDDWKSRLAGDALAQADLVHGRTLFQKTCSNCHRLYGEGGRIGPDITGSNRHNLDYLLLNILDPSATVPREFTVSAILLSDGRVITGVVIRRTDQTLTVQTEKEEQVIPVSDVELIRESQQSLMPDGLLKQMSEGDIRDLIGYLQTRQQVALP